MKLHADAPTSLNTITAYGADWIEINRERFDGAIVVMPEGAVSAWPARQFDALTPDDFEALLAREPELVIFGTGAKQRFPHPRLTAPLLQARVGIEIMSTHAACRTYNILMAEGRRVLAVLLPG
jgi:uncharacterized protein